MLVGRVVAVPLVGPSGVKYRVLAEVSESHEKAAQPQFYGGFMRVQSAMPLCTRGESKGNEHRAGLP